ncbi:hypothetical protein HY626_00015 [Candidatus Uhrbacteria bacterium]|nr:hypothetical protein [Candidatus Uhrbacteria bacterium]
MKSNEQPKDTEKGYCGHGNKPPCTKCLEKHEKMQSSREYVHSPVLQDVLRDRIIFEREVLSDSDVLLIGDGQGLDTKQFIDMGVEPDHISSVNYESSEVDEANRRLEETGVVMKQADATSWDSLLRAGVLEASQDVLVLLHVLEVSDIRSDAERRLVENMVRVLRDGGEALVSQYKHKLTQEQATMLGIEEIKPEYLERRFGKDWQEIFTREYGQPWYEGMRYSEISRIRSKDELLKLFSDHFEINLEETDDSYVLKLKKKVSR